MDSKPCVDGGKHSFEPRYSITPANDGVIRHLSSLYSGSRYSGSAVTEQIVASQTRVYEGDICTACGLFVERRKHDLTVHDKKSSVMSSFDNIREQVEACVFYGTGDETYELWQALCSVCYQLSSLGYESEALTVLGWIQEEAEYSRRFCEDNYDSLDEVDSAKGRFE